MIDYDPHDWRAHLLDIRGSVLREIVPRIVPCVAWAAAVTAEHHYNAVMPYLCAGLWSCRQLAIPSAGHLMVGTALGLLLVVRTNASYDRFWEGRKMWGGIVNECRNMARVASVVLRDAPELRRRLLHWTIAWPYAAMHQLRGRNSLGDAAALLPPLEVDEVVQASHPPTAVARKMTATLDLARREGLISDYLFGVVDQNTQLLIDYVGACERIHKTPLPFAYVVHLRRALIVYCYTLPFALVETFGWLTIVCTACVAFIFMGIEEIGVEIEDPFGDDENDLPLERFCAMLREQLSEWVDAKS